MKATIVIQGAEEFERQLATLPDRIERKVIRKAVKAAHTVTLETCRAAARALARGTGELYARGEEDISMSELLARQMVLKPAARQSRGSYAMHVLLASTPEFFHYARGARTVVNYAYVDRHGAQRRRIGKTVGVSYIPAAIEFGHGSDKEGAARPFMRPAADQSQSAAIQRFTDELRIGLLREAIMTRVGGGA